MRGFVAIGAGLPFHGTKDHQILVYRKGRFIRLMAGRTGSFGMHTFQNKIGIVIKAGSRLERFLIMAPQAIAGLLTALMHIFMAGQTLLFQSQHG